MDPCKATRNIVFAVVLLILVIIYAIVYGSETFMRVMLGISATVLAYVIWSLDNFVPPN